MKKEEKLLHAIGGVDNDLIADAMKPRKRKKPVLLRWTAAAACICLLLTVTVGAAKWGVEWWHGKDERYEKYTVDWKYPLAPVTVRQEAIDELERWVLWAWGVDGRREDGIRATWPDTYYIGAYLENAQRIRTVADLEEYLGIELTTSPEIDANCLAVRERRESREGNRIIAAIELLGLTEVISDAEIEYAETNKVSLGGIEVELDLGYCGTNCKARMKIFIPLTQNFADDFPAEDWWFASVAGPTWSDYEDGQFDVEELEISGKEVVVFSEPVDDLDGGATALAVYSNGGIGYYLYCIAEDWDNSESHPTVYQHGRERLMELLENLE